MPAQMGTRKKHTRFYITREGKSRKQSIGRTFLSPSSSHNPKPYLLQTQDRASPMLPPSSSSSSSSAPPLLRSSSSSAIATQTAPAKAGGNGRGMSLTILVITGIVALVFVVSASIHLLLRHLSRRRHQITHPRRSSSDDSTSSASSATSSFHLNPSLADEQRDSLIASLPLFTLPSASSANATDCAVCLSRFDAGEQLRLLPACRHAFHPPCVDTWLRSTPSCPLCRAPVVHHIRSPSGSFHVEIGSVSHRDGGAASAPPPPQHGRAYSLGSSFEYVVEDEIEAVVAAVASHVRRGSADAKDPSASAAVGSGRGWLREYVDRLASSASSSFSSMRCSGRWSRRTDSANFPSGWDLERSLPAEEAAAYQSFYRWLMGA